MLLLGQWGHTVMVLPTDDAALMTLTQETFDLILLDGHMAEITSRAVIAAVRAQERVTSVRVPIIALRGHTRTEHRKRCLFTGIDGCVATPIQAADLAKAIDHVLAGQNACTRCLEAGHARSTA
jgi:CheY-like chemotaxis protein